MKKHSYRHKLRPPSSVSQVSFAEIGRRIGLSEMYAQMLCSRALGKLAKRPDAHIVFDGLMAGLIDRRRDILQARSAECRPDFVKAWNETLH